MSTIKLLLTADGSDVVEVDRDEYRAAREAGELAEFLDVYTSDLDTDITVHEPDGTMVLLPEGNVLLPAPADSMPVFEIKAKDKLASLAVAHYAQMCLDRGLDDQAREVQRALTEIDAWREAHPGEVKLPDHKHLPVGELS